MDGNTKWTLITDYPDYKISNSGEVVSLRFGKEKTLKTRKNEKGYILVSIIKNQHPRSFKVHRLVALHFVPNPENKETVNHLDGDKTNNNDWNLEWSTNLENHTHARLTGLINDYGENNKGAKLNNYDVLEIRRSSLSHQELAKKFNVSRSLIGRVKQRLAWKHI